MHRQRADTDSGDLYIADTAGKDRNTETTDTGTLQYIAQTVLKKKPQNCNKFDYVWHELCHLKTNI